MEDIENLEPEIHRIFEENSLFHDDQEKIVTLRNAVVSFLQKCKNPQGTREISERLSNIITMRPKRVDDLTAFQRPGFRLLQLGIPFSINSGVVTVVKNITRAFEKQGANVALINHWWHRYSYWDKKTQSWTNVKLSPFNLLRGDGRFVDMKWGLRPLLTKLREVYKYYPHVCHVHTHTFYFDEALPALSSLFPNVPIIYTLHAFIPYMKLKRVEQLRLLNNEMSPEEIKQIRLKNYNGRERAQEAMIVLADKIITISPMHKVAFDRIYSEFQQKGVCIPNGTDFELYTELFNTSQKLEELKAKIAPQGQRVVIYVGRIEAQKGARRLLEGFNLIAKKYHDVQLVLVGAHEKEEIKLIELGIERQFLSRVHYAGWVKDKSELAAYYKLADVMLQPVFTKDLYGMAVLEAMLLKVPVISCPGKLTVGNCETAEKILEAADIIFHNKTAIEKHLETTKKYVVENHSLEAVFKKHMELYANVRIAPGELKRLAS